MSCLIIENYKLSVFAQKKGVKLSEKPLIIDFEINKVSTLAISSSALFQSRSPGSIADRTFTPQGSPVLKLQGLPDLKRCDSPDLTGSRRYDKKSLVFNNFDNK